jgi:photosystem II stability/assembly factor-like uncharacterized protein
MTQFCQRVFDGRSGPLAGRFRFRPCLEILEDRTVLSVLAVTNLADSGVGSLRGQIGAAASGDTIVFDSSLRGTIALTSGELDLTGNLTIQGPGAANLTVSGGNTQRIFHVEPGANVTISGLTIANGHASDNGGGIESEGSLSLSNSTLSGNSAGSAGGGLHFLVLNTGSASLTVTGSTFMNNSAGAGGGLFSRVDNRSGQVNVNVANTNFSGNTAREFGGGLDSMVSLAGTASANVTVSDGTFSGNSVALQAGGAIASTFHTADISQGGVSLSGVVIRNNSAQNGGGVYSEVASSDASTAAATISSDTLESNAASQFGGGLYSILISNDDSRATLTYSGSTAARVDNNTARDGAGIYNQVTTNGSGSATAGFINNQNSFNIASESGGGFYSLVNTTGSGTAAATVGFGNVFANEALSSQGGGIYSSVTVTGSGSANMTVNSLALTDNAAGLSGGGIYDAVMDTGSGSASTSVSGLANTNTAGNGGGGGIFLTVSAQDTGAASATLSPLTASGNTTTGSGGGISATVVSSGLGAASVAVTSVTAGGNTAGFFGGGFFARLTGGDAGPTTLTVNTSTLAGNNASQGGGLFASVNTNGPSPRAAAGVTLNGSTVSGNRAGTGAGLFFDLASGGLGGAAQAAVNTSTISGNSATGVGGGLFVREQDTAATAATLTVTNSTLYANQGVNGGGLMATSAGLVNAASGVTLLSDTVAFNSASSSGGGLDAVGGPFTVRSSIVAANTAGSGADAAGIFRSAGHNLIGQITGSSGWGTTDLTGTAASPLDARFGDFTSVGGATRTLALLGDSPAVGNGDPAGPTTDQRGITRSRTAPTIGAVEVLQPSSFAVTSSVTSIRSGTAFSVTVSALDASGHLLSTFVGTVHFTSSDPNAILPADYTFTVADAGQHTFTFGVTLQANGSQTVTAAGGGITGTATFLVFSQPGSFRVTPAIANVSAGSAFSVTISALDGSGNVLTGYDGTVHFSSSDGAATLPADYTFTAADRGTHTFKSGVTLHSAGPQSVSVTGDGVTGTATINVVPLPSSFLVEPAFTTVPSASPFPVTVSALDSNGNVLPTYTGTIHFTSSDGAATLPADFTFTTADAATHTFFFFPGVTLQTQGDQTISVTGDGVSGTATVSVVGPLVSLVNPVTWTAVGPAPLNFGQAPGGLPVSGRISAIAADPNNPNVVYLAAAGGGVWKTTDAGARWTPLTDDQATLFMGALALAPSDPNIIYAGTGEATNSVLSFTGHGVLKSTDGGATWTLLGQDVFDRHTIAQIVVSPVDPNTVYVAVAGSGVNGVTANGGIWKSTDGGLTWTDTTAAISTNAPFSDVEMDPADPQTLYAAAGNFRGSAINGVYKTTDGGATWLVAGNFPRGIAEGRITIAIAPSDARTLYATIAASGQAGTTLGRVFAIMKSTDGGASWVALPNTPDLGGSGWYGLPLVVDPANVNIVYASGGGSQIVESADGGLTWFSLATGADGRGPHVDHHAFAFDANGRLLDGNDGGIWRLDNAAPGSLHWTDLNTNLDLTQYIGIALDPTNPGIAYGGSQDNGTSLFTGGLGWQLTEGGDGGFVRVDPSHPSTVYHELVNISLERSDNGGLSWVPKTSGINLNDPHDTYVPFVLDPSNPSRLLLGSNRVYETTNRGDSWQAISTPLSGGWTVSSNIDSLATAAADRNTVYASAGGHIFVTIDDGHSWQQRDVPGIADHIQDLQVDPADPRTAYAVRDRFGGGHVFRTTDGGLHWTDISGNLPDLPAFTLALDSRSNTLYVGMDDGVYVSADQGSSWARFGASLPHVQVRDLELNTNLQILAAGTHGRGMWEILLSPPPSPSIPPGPAASSARPTITGVTDNGGGTFTLTATLPYGIPGGNDPAMATNYPTVQLVDGNGNVFSVQTFNWTIGVAPGDKPVSTEFTLPAGLPDGTYSLFVIANGIASDPFDFTVG